MKPAPSKTMALPVFTLYPIFSATHGREPREKELSYASSIAAAMAEDMRLHRVGVERARELVFRKANLLQRRIATYLIMDRMPLRAKHTSASYLSVSKVLAKDCKGKTKTLIQPKVTLADILKDLTF